ENNPKVERGSQDTFWNLNQHEALMYSRIQSVEVLLNKLRAICTKEDDTFANILDAVGEFGTFQRRLVVLICIFNIMAGFFMSVDMFVFGDPEPYCNTSWILTVGPNLSEVEQLNLTLPQDSRGSFLTCLMYLPVPWDLSSIIQFGLNHTVTCQDGWIYPGSIKQSLNIEDLVCGMEPEKDTVQTMFMAGTLTGSLIFGLLSDRFGRHPAILLSLLSLITFGFGTAFVSYFHAYLFFHFCVSQAIVGCVISSTSLVTEWLVGEHRAHAIILGHCCLSVGNVFLVWVAYSFPHWRLLFLLGGAPVFPLLICIWMVPESSRWLMVNGNVEEAKKVLCYAASVNKKTIPLTLLGKMHLHRKKVTKASLLDFYNNKRLCNLIVVLAIVWFAISYSYFTMSLKMKDVGVNIYFRELIRAFLEVPARLCSMLIMEQIKRKWSLAVTLLLASILCLLVILLPEGADNLASKKGEWPQIQALELISIKVLAIILGQFSLISACIVLFIYNAELLPTVLRTTGVGFTALFFGAGSISSLTVINQTSSHLPIFLCCISAILAFGFSYLLPEVQDQPFCDSLDY
uniref:Major facilitator superfamily (MFS) profile domain-containing protein n=1 Tax=Otolemur garnettii TaxID=30611 RepID=H0XZM2_OTOGA